MWWRSHRVTNRGDGPTSYGDPGVAPRGRCEMLSSRKGATVGDLKLFRIAAGTASELPGSSVALEKSLQTLIEENMETLFGTRFLATEFVTGRSHNGRIDSLGLDENGSPVIFEYKRSRDQNVINQGLFYLDWLLDHRGDFQMLVMEKLGAEAAHQVDWSNPRLVCVAGDFTRHDEHAVRQINHSIELVRYRDFGGELLALEMVTAVTGSPKAAPTGGGGTNPARVYRGGGDKTVTEFLTDSPASLKNLFDDLEAVLVGFGDDVQKTVRKGYVAYKRLRNFACVEVHPTNHELIIYIKVNPDAVELIPGFTRDVRNIGHFGTGDLEIRIRDKSRWEDVADLVRRSYDAS